MFNYNDLRVILPKRGMVMMGNQHKLLDEKAKFELEQRIAMDAQPALQTTNNASILAYYTTFIDPRIVEYLFAPLEAVNVAGSERKMGTWLDDLIAFNVVEWTGQVSSYGDYSEAGTSGANANYPQRQPYIYQTMTSWGVREIERAGLQKLDWLAQKSEASIWTLNNFQNNSYFFGVAGLRNYGLLNDPNLPAPIAPSGSGSAALWSNKTALQIYNDILSIVTDLLTRGKGLVNKNTPMTMAFSSYADGEMGKTNDYGFSVTDLVKKNFPNMKIVVAPQMSTVAGELVRIKADNVRNQPTEECSFNEKLRAFPIITLSSSYKQKKAQGTNGAVIYRPGFVSSMLGV